LLEPYLSLPILIVSTWTFLPLQRWLPLHPAIVLGVAVILATLILFLFCMVWIWSQEMDEEERTEEPVQ